MRRTLGTAVFSGMLGVTLFGIFLTPVFYYVIQWLGSLRHEPLPKRIPPMNESLQTLDVMAVGAHPDDIEIACGGTLAKLSQQGYRVGIVDLTDGEPTPLSPGPEVRLAEARRAAETLGVALASRSTCPTGGCSTVSRPAWLAKEFRKHRPRLVIGLGAGTPLASPDHGQAQMITEAAVFYSRLTKWEQYFDGLPVHTVPRLLYAFLAFRQLSPVAAGGFVVDISDTLETKMAALACYESQFPAAKAHHVDGIAAYARQQGMAAGFAAGELLATPGTLGTGDLMGLLFGPKGATEPFSLGRREACKRLCVRRWWACWGGPDSSAIGVPQAQEGPPVAENLLRLRRPDRQAIGATRVVRVMYAIGFLRAKIARPPSLSARSRHKSQAALCRGPADAPNLAQAKSADQSRTNRKTKHMASLSIATDDLIAPICARRMPVALAVHRRIPHPAASRRACATCSAFRAITSFPSTRNWKRAGCD